MSADDPDVAVFPDQPLIVEADPVRIDQIIANILTNAIKYTPEGGHVTLKLESEADLEGTWTREEVSTAA